MDRQEIELLRAVFDEKVRFDYFRDRYALLLLGYLIGDGMPLHTVKRSALRGLLDKPIMKPIAAQAAGGVLTPQHLALGWPVDGREIVTYYVTTGVWGDRRFRRYWNFYQTTRPSANLVLHLTFSEQHNDSYDRFVRRTNRHLFTYHGHPNDDERLTLAWSRIDLSLAHGEALIEEVQSDWVRKARWMASGRLQTLPPGATVCDYCWLPACLRNCKGNGSRVRVRDLHRYLDEVLPVHAALWDEAMLAATIVFLRDEVGIGRIFYHTFEGGSLLKQIGTGVAHQPPRSLYTTLPRRFGFRLTEEQPRFLVKNGNRRIHWQMREVKFRMLDV